MTIENTASQPASSRLDFSLARLFPANIETLLFVSLLALALVSRFYDLGARVMSHDEVNHVAPSYDFSQGRGFRYDPMSHGPLQFHLIALSYFLLGDNDFTSRVPAALFSVATIGFALLAFRRYLGRWGALAAGLLLLISPYMLYYGRYARNEAFIIFWGLVTLYALLRYLERGGTGALVLFVLINAFHFTDKSTAYIFAAEQLLFLAGYFVLRVSRREWVNPSYRLRCLLGLGATGLFLAGAALLYAVEKPVDLLQIGLLALIALAAGMTTIVMLVRGLGWAQIRAERSFDLALLLGTLILPLLAALPVKLIKYNPLDYSSVGLWRSLAFIVPLGLLAVGLGLWWKPRAWPFYAVLFYTPFVLFYTTFFTNPVGLAGGFMGALGYWMDQQAVSRGSQPWFYYLLIQIPVYEFLPAFGLIVAVVIGVWKRLWAAQPEQPFERPHLEDGAAAIQPPPTLALLVFWSISSLLAFSIAGEKMPWLTVHIALPMILTAAWAVGYLIQTTRWGEVRQWHGWQIAGQVLRVTCLAFLAVLAVFTARAAYRAAYINYDSATEYLVYAHSGPAPKRILKEIEALSLRTTDGLGLVVAYDNFVRYPYWWYMRHYTNKIDFDVNPTNDLRRAAVILAGADNESKLTPIIRNDYVQYDYIRMWWPNQDYWRLKWEDIDAERKAQAPQDEVSTLPPMGLGEYLWRMWGHIRPFFTDARVRSAIIQIWLNRNYQEYAALQNNSQDFTPENWNPADRMRVYIRKDVALELGSGAGQQTPSVSDTYDQATIQLNSDAAFGASGSEPGNFQAPHAVAVAPDGSLYVADSRNHRIQHLSSTGESLQVWGSFADVAKGSAPGGTFNEPWGVAVGPDGSVYVADTWNNRVQKFSSDGQFEQMWDAWQQGGAAQGFWGPRGIAVDAHGHVFISDTGNKRVVVFDADGGYISQFGEGGQNPGQLNEPVGLAVDGQGRVYVADTWNQRVQVFAPDASGANFAPATNWSVEAWYGQTLEDKPYIAVNQSGQVIISDPTTCRVIEFQPDGQVAHVWGQCGSGADGFGQPAGVAVDSAGGVWVSDAVNQRLLHFTLP